MHSRASISPISSAKKSTEQGYTRLRPPFPCPCLRVMGFISFFQSCGSPATAWLGHQIRKNDSNLTRPGSLQHCTPEKMLGVRENPDTRHLVPFLTYEVTYRSPKCPRPSSTEDTEDTEATISLKCAHRYHPKASLNCYLLN